MNNPAVCLKIYTTLAAILCFSACYRPLPIRVVDMNPLGWTAQEAVSVVYSNEDTVTPRTLSFLFRHDGAYAYDRLTCLVTTTTPDGYRWHDTVALQSFRGNRRPGRSYDTEQPFREHVVFNQRGDYRFTFSPLMPSGTVRNVEAVGIHIY